MKRENVYAATGDNDELGEHWPLNGDALPRQEEKLEDHWRRNGELGRGNDVVVLSGHGWSRLGCEHRAGALTCPWLTRSWCGPTPSNECLLVGSAGADTGESWKARIGMAPGPYLVRCVVAEQVSLTMVMAARERRGCHALPRLRRGCTTLRSIVHFAASR